MMFCMPAHVADLRDACRSPSEFGFDDAILVVVDEFEAFSGDLVGEVLIDGAKEAAFEELAEALETLIDAIGKRVSFADARTSGATWASCVAKARLLDRFLNRR